VEDIECIVCGTKARVPSGTPPIQRTCPQHLGQVPPAIATLREWVAPDRLAGVVEQYTARFAIEVLYGLALEFEERGRNSVTDRRACNDCARRVHRVIRDLKLLIPDLPRGPGDW